MKRPHFALPEIYDDSLSYYDVLRKLIKSMHVISDNLNKIPEQIANEAKARLLGDQNLQQNITAEASARETADNELRELISTSSGGVTEAQLNEEITNRQNADNALQEKINTNKNDISELKGDLIDQGALVNKPKLEFIGNATIGQTGYITTNESYDAYIIKCAGFDKIEVSTANIYGWFSVKPIIDRSKTIDGNRYFDLSNSVLTIPDGAVYLALIVQKETSTTVRTPIKTINEKLEDLNESIRNSSPYTAVDDLTITKTVGGFVNASTKSITSYSNYWYSELIALERGKGIRVSSQDPSGSAVARISKWTSDGSKCLNVIDRGTTTQSTYEYYASDEIEYIRFSGHNGHIFEANFIGLITPIDFESGVKKLIYDRFPYLDLSMFNDIAVCGDSFTSGTVWNDGVLLGENENISWGKILGRMIGANVSVYASGGSDTNTWQTRNNCLPKLLSDSPHQLYVIVLGINDATYVTKGSISDIHDNYEDNPNTYYGNYGKIIEQIKAHAPNAKIVISKILMPSKDGLGTYGYSSNAIEEIANHYEIPFLETKNSDYLVSDFYMCNMIGGHPTAPLYSGIAKSVKALLEKSMMENIHYFDDYYPQIIN